MNTRGGLTIVQGTPLSKSDIAHAFKATSDIPQAVVVTLNATRETDSPFSKPLAPPRFLADSVANARSTMAEFGVKKIVIMSAFGVADSFNNLNCLLKLAIRKTNMAAQFVDHGQVDAETKASNLEWVLVRPCMLTGGEAAPVKQMGDHGERAGLMSNISRKSVASYMIDAVEMSGWNRRTPVISN